MERREALAREDIVGKERPGGWRVLEHLTKCGLRLAASALPGHWLKKMQDLRPQPISNELKSAYEQGPLVVGMPIKILEALL